MGTWGGEGEREGEETRRGWGRWGLGERKESGKGEVMMKEGLGGPEGTCMYHKTKKAEYVDKRWLHQGD